MATRSNLILSFSNPSSQVSRTEETRPSRAIRTVRISYRKVSCRQIIPSTVSDLSRRYCLESLPFPPARRAFAARSPFDIKLLSGSLKPRFGLCVSLHTTGHFSTAAPTEHRRKRLVSPFDDLCLAPVQHFVSSLLGPNLSCRGQRTEWISVAEPRSCTGLFFPPALFVARPTRQTQDGRLCQRNHAEPPRNARPGPSRTPACFPG